MSQTLITRNAIKNTNLTQAVKTFLLRQIPCQFQPGKITTNNYQIFIAALVAIHRNARPNYQVPILTFANNIALQFEAPNSTATPNKNTSTSRNGWGQ